MSVIEDLRAEKERKAQHATNRVAGLNKPRKEMPMHRDGTPKDLVAYASGRLSYAIRKELGEEEIEIRRRELAGAQMERFLGDMLERGSVPTQEMAKNLAKLLLDAASAA